MRKIWRLMGQEQPRTLVLLCGLTLAGAALSPGFLSPAFPQTRLSGSAVFQLVAAALPWLFTPAAWSLWHALGSMLGVALLWQGALYAFPSLRLRRSGTVASLLIGGAVTLSISGGLIGQTGATEVGLLAALALGVLAAASSMVRDFFDMDADRRAGLRTLPLLVGTSTAISISMVAVTAAYLLAIFLLLQRIGMQERVLGLFGLTLGAHLHVLRQLGQDPSPKGARRAGRYVVLIFLGVTALYVAAQA